jgi:UDP-N-acetylglucosamine 3-dehydrogenase
MLKTKVAVIGVGNMGKNHARVYSKLHDVELVAVCDKNKESAKTIAEAYQTDFYSSCKEMFEREKEIDAVSIAVPTMSHQEVALCAIEYGKHILLEKPIAASLDAARKIVESAENAEVKLMVGHVERFNPAVVKAKQLINDGKLGQIVSVSSKRVGPYAPRLSDIGVCLDLAIHDIDVMRFITNQEVCEVYARIGPNRCEQEDNASILLTLENGITGLIDTNWLTPTKIRRLDITAMEGYATLDYISQEIFLYGEVLSKNPADYEELVFAYGRPKMAKIRVEKEEPLKLELEHFIQAITDNKVPETDGESAIKSLTVALAALKSARQGFPVGCADFADLNR